MSTRANFIIKFNNEYTLFYKHCDGYPEGLGEIIKASAFLTSLSIPYSINMKEFKKIYNAEDVNFYLRGLLENVEGVESEGSFADVKELESYLHGDIEYLYLIEFSNTGDIELSYEPTECDSQGVALHNLLLGECNKL